jgi:hypothetical protein
MGAVLQPGLGPGQAAALSAAERSDAFVEQDRAL